MAYQPLPEVKKAYEICGELISVVFIDRKSHKNGFEGFCACIFINHPIYPNSKLPLLIMMIPHVKVGDISPTKAVREIY